MGKQSMYGHQELYKQAQTPSPYRKSDTAEVTAILYMIRKSDTAKVTAILYMMFPMVRPLPLRKGSLSSRPFMPATNSRSVRGSKMVSQGAARPSWRLKIFTYGFQYIPVRICESVQAVAETFYCRDARLLR